MKRNGLFEGVALAAHTNSFALPGPSGKACVCANAHVHASPNMRAAAPADEDSFGSLIFCSTAALLPSANPLRFCSQIPMRGVYLKFCTIVTTTLVWREAELLQPAGRWSRHLLSRSGSLRYGASLRRKQLLRARKPGSCAVHAKGVIDASEKHAMEIAGPACQAHPPCRSITLCGPQAELRSQTECLRIIRTSTPR